MPTTDNYTLGRGKVHFSRFRTGTTTPAGYIYIGNTPEFSLTIESQTLDHFSSDEGIREKDDSVPLEVNRTGSMTTDAIKAANVALFFFGDDTTVTQTVVALHDETFTDVLAGASYRLGVSDTLPAGYMGINATGFEVAVGATTMTGGGVDYTMDLDRGILSLVEGGGIDAGDDVVVSFAVRASTRSRVISGSEPVEGAMMYVTKNPKGDDCVFSMPYVKITPNGDYALKGDDWQTIPFNIEILKPAGGDAIYRDGLPVYS